MVIVDASHGEQRGCHVGCGPDRPDPSIPWVDNAACPTSAGIDFITRRGRPADESTEAGHPVPRPPMAQLDIREPFPCARNRARHAQAATCSSPFNPPVNCLEGFGGSIGPLGRKPLVFVSDCHCSSCSQPRTCPACGLASIRFGQLIA